MSNADEIRTQGLHFAIHCATGASLLKANRNLLIQGFLATLQSRAVSFMSEEIDSERLTPPRSVSHLGVETDQPEGKARALCALTAAIQVVSWRPLQS